jgi:hypothetical protein
MMQFEGTCIGEPFFQTAILYSSRGTCKELYPLKLAGVDRKNQAISKKHHRKDSKPSSKP